MSSGRLDGVDTKAGGSWARAQRAGATGEFFTLARALRAFKAGPLAGDPSDRALAKAAGVSPTTIGDWLRGTRFPQDIGKVLIVVRMVRAAAAARGVAGPAGLLDEDRWRAAYQEEARRRAGVVSDAVQHAQAVSVLAGHPAECGRVRLTCGGWACTRRSACRGSPTGSRRSTCRGMSMPTGPASGPGGGRGGAGRVRAAGRRVLGRQDPVRGRGGPGAAAGLVAGAPGRPGRGRRAGGRAAAADGGVAG